MSDGVIQVFDIMRLFWACVVQNWILSFGIILLVLNLVVTLINGSTRQ